jgi:uncharacterized protein YndB with AHSA1/START domain
MDKPAQVYVTYIAASPQKVWDALSDPTLTKLYWYDHRNVSSWEVGASWSHVDDSDGATDIVGTVLECDPPKKLVVSWAYPDRANDPSAHSRVTYEVEPFGDAVKLVVTHSDLEPGSPMATGVGRGWPMVLSGLKTLLETGRPLVIAHPNSVVATA